MALPVWLWLSGARESLLVAAVVEIAAIYRSLARSIPALRSVACALRQIAGSTPELAYTNILAFNFRRQKIICTFFLLERLGGKREMGTGTEHASLLDAFPERALVGSFPGLTSRAAFL